MRPNIFSFIPFSLSALAFEYSYICFLISLTFGAIVFFLALFFVFNCASYAVQRLIYLYAQMLPFDSVQLVLLPRLALCSCTWAY